MAATRAAAVTAAAGFSMRTPTAATRGIEATEASSDGMPRRNGPSPSTEAKAFSNTRKRFIVR